MTPLIERLSVEVKSRILGIIGLTLTVAVILLELNGLLPIQEAERSIIPTQYKFMSDLVIVAFFHVLIFCPQWDILLCFVTIAAGVMNILYGGHTLGLLFYAFGFAVAMRHGFFRRWKRVKVPLMFAGFLIPLAMQIGIGFDIFVISLINILITVALIFGFLFLFHDQLRGFYARKVPLEFSTKEFTPRQIRCVRGCLAGKPFREIAEELAVSESVIKHEMTEVYRLLRVESRSGFDALMAIREPRFPE